MLYGLATTLQAIMGSGSGACLGSTSSHGGVYFKDILLTVIQIAILVVAWRSFRTTKQEHNKNAFFALLPQIDNLITPNQITTFMGQFTAERELQIEAEFKQMDKAELKEDSKFLKWFSEKLEGISVSDHFRRSRLFRAFERLRKDADKTRKELFRDALCSRIGDEPTRFLILQAVRERDEEMLKIFGSFPLAFENLHRMPSLQKEIIQRFGKQ